MSFNQKFTNEIKMAHDTVTYHGHSQMSQILDNDASHVTNCFFNLVNDND